MSHTQLSFNLSTSDKVKSVHLLGSWDNYKQQLPLSESRAGKWKGTFKFPSSMVKAGSRYWYYFHIDGYKPVHDPKEASTTEPTTGRKLNILNVPGKSSSSGSTAAAATTSRISYSSKRNSVDVPKGRGLSPSRIIHPKPSKPYESRRVREADYSTSPSRHMDDICEKLEQASLYKLRNVSPPSSVGSSLSSRGSGGSSPSSLSSLSDPSSSSSNCRCNKYGVTRKGDRVKLDCGGRACGYSDDSESCSSIEDTDSSSEEEQVRRPVKPRYQEIAPRRSAATSSSDRRRR